MKEPMCNYVFKVASSAMYQFRRKIPQDLIPHYGVRVSVKLDEDKRLIKLGASIRARRKDLELSQEELADYAGIDRSHMGKIERGERNVSILNIVRIADALSCKPSDLLFVAGL